MNPIGRAQKAGALTDSLAKPVHPGGVMVYLGDSITDVEAFEAVPAGGGLAVWFNGNRQRSAPRKWWWWRDSAWPVAMLLAPLGLWGEDGVLEVAAPETRKKSRALVLPEASSNPVPSSLEGRLCPSV